MKLKYIFLKIFIILSLLAGCAGSDGSGQTETGPSPQTGLPTTTVQIITTERTYNITAEVAATQEQQRIGMMHRTYVGEDQGMIFVYQDEDYRSFWMKDTLIPLDFVWINKGRVVEITQNVQPQDYQPPQTLSPQQPVDQVLELNAGAISKLGISPSQSVSLD